MAPGNGGFRIRGTECWNRKSHTDCGAHQEEGTEAEEGEHAEETGKLPGGGRTGGVADHVVPAPHAGDGPGMAGRMVQVVKAPNREEGGLYRPAGM